MRDQPNRLGYVVVAVEDVGASVDFYERAFGLPCDHVDDDGSYGEVRGANSVRIGFSAEWHIDETSDVAYRRNRPSEAAPGVFLHLIAGDVERSYERALAAGAAGVTPPVMTPWGLHARVRDPNGLVVELSAAAPGWLD